jgi:hypothetical protein
MTQPNQTFSNGMIMSAELLEMWSLLWTTLVCVDTQRKTHGKLLEESPQFFNTLESKMLKENIVFLPRNQGLGCWMEPRSDVMQKYD